MPHLDVYALDSDLTGREEALIGAAVLSGLAAGVTEAIAGVLGEHVRTGLAIDFVGQSDGRHFEAH